LYTRIIHYISAARYVMLYGLSIYLSSDAAQNLTDEYCCINVHSCRARVTGTTESVQLEDNYTVSQKKTVPVLFCE